jgi:SAM-dependent methyltransferase
VHQLGYRHFEGSSFAERFGARLASSVSYSARWRACCDLIPHYVLNGRLLEIGCGNGSNLSRLRDLGWKNLHGVELAPAAAAMSHQLGFDVYGGTIEKALKHYPDKHFDVIVSSMVIEHLLNPFETIGTIAKKLKPGGEFLFSTVIRDSLDGYVFGQYGVSYDFPRHMVFFCKNDLYQMLNENFDSIRSCHQSTPIDFQRPARLRAGRFDRHILRFFELPGASRLVWLLAQLRLMGRVSYRCRRKYC